MYRFSLRAILPLAWLPFSQAAAEASSRIWIDPDTGYSTKDDTVSSTAVDSGVTSQSAPLPPRGSVASQVNMSKQEYQSEPNLSLTLNHKWAVFRSNMLGPTYGFAVEIAKTH
jgi:hypothetical protein